jgi:hypothetical protein
MGGRVARGRKRRGLVADLESLPGIGPSLAADLRRLGIETPAGLRGRSPEALYERLCAVTGARQDRCVLYAFRCAVYAASRTRHDRELLRWWNWTDERRPRRTVR